MLALSLGQNPGLPVGFSVRREEQVVFKDAALSCRLAALEEPVVRIDGRRHLLSMSFVRRLQQRVTQAESQGQVGTDTPRILKEVLKLVGFELAFDECAVWLKRAGGWAGDDVVGNGVPFGDRSDDGGVGVVE